jgi:flagellum-specific peptidoglycan hydrolase FlgJ
MNPNLPKIARAAVDAEGQTGCPAELMAAQCILETGWLAAAPENNCFGIKSYAGNFGRQLLRTKEWFTDEQLRHFLALGDQRHAEMDAAVPPRSDGRKRYAVWDWFATFKDLGDCFAKRAAMWDKGPYSKAATAFKQGGGLEDLVRGIAPVYATDPKYADSVLGIIHQRDVQTAILQARSA